MATKKEMIREMISLDAYIAIKYGNQILGKKEWSELRTGVRASRKQLKELEKEYE